MALYPLGTEEKKNKEHKLVLVARNELMLSGVEEVIGFDEENVHVRSSEGELYVEGNEIKIGTLDTESGNVTLSGRIDAIYYISEHGGKKKRGIFARNSR